MQLISSMFENKSDKKYAVRIWVFQFVWEQPQQVEKGYL